MEFYPIKCNRDITPDYPNLLVTGDGMTLLDDLTWWINQDIPADIMAIGRSITKFPKVKHWVSVDSEELKDWAENLPGDPIRHTMGDWPWFDVDWGVKNCEITPDDIIWHGSSSLFAAHIGLSMGYDRIVLAGCPLDDKGHWYFDGLDENRGPDWNNQSFIAWQEFKEYPGSEKVRSLSGFTAEVMGRPTKEWLRA